MRQDIVKCAYCGNQDGTEAHHIYKRSTHPHMIDDPKNLVRLCNVCHRRTETDNSFLKALQEIFYEWREKNLDLYLRAQATIEAMMDGNDIEFLTPQMTDSYLQLMSAQYSHLSEKLAAIEKEQPKFYMALMAEMQSSKMPKTKLDMEWRVTDMGQEQIYLGRKLKAMEKSMSNLRERMRRFNSEKFIR